MLEITPVKAFNDNYLWLFRQPGSNACGIVDPGDAQPVLKAIAELGLTLEAILITHHHGDHTGGISALREAFNVPVYGPDSPNIPAVDHPLHEGDEIELFGEKFRILEIPGHTLDHIAYVTQGENPVLFCGDTLFAGGCGRVFEGTHAMMHHSLQKLAALQPGTRVYSAHEYTMSNLAFAHAVTPANATLQNRINREQGKRDNGQPTLPTSIAEELATNPFLRCSDDEIILSAKNHSGEELGKPEDVFAVIRGWKDSF